MTKPQRAHLWEFERLERALEAHHIPDGYDVAKFLECLPPFHPVLQQAHDVRCKACDVMTQQGDTVFTTHDPVNPSPVLCYGCGIGWELYKHRLAVEDAVDIPAVGGPRP